MARSKRGGAPGSFSETLLEIIDILVNVFFGGFRCLIFEVSNPRDHPSNTGFLRGFRFFRSLFCFVRHIIDGIFGTFGPVYQRTGGGIVRLFDLVHQLQPLGLKVQEFVFRHALRFFGFNNQVEIVKLPLVAGFLHLAEFHLNGEFIGTGLSELLFFLA